MHCSFGVVLLGFRVLLNKQFSSYGYARDATVFST